MSKKCTIYGKVASSGNNVSHSKRRTRRKFNPNLQKINILLDGAKKKTYVCTRCIRSDKITKA